MNDSSIDLHCHPSLKPFGKSFKFEPQKQNHINNGKVAITPSIRKDKTIWP
jgi:hypothetical protein